MEIEIDGDRLFGDIEANAEFGALPGEGHGRTVLVGSEANRAARERLVSRMEDAGLEVRVDSVGNIAGRWTPESADPDAAPVASGSHLDSVPEGGVFDGPLGTYAALESVRAMREAGVAPDRPIEVVNFTEEEGTRFHGLLGSSVATGAMSVEEAYALTDDAGESFGDAIEGIGFRGDDEIDARGWDAFLELHVEQGTRLESAGVPVGVVTAITGIAHAEARIEGEANHAGTTPMGERADALCAASEFVLDVERAAREVVAAESDSAVGTVGKSNVRPNATNVVPGAVVMGVDIRDVERDAMEAVVERARASLARIARDRGVETSFERDYDLAPTPMAGRARDALSAAADDAGLGSMDLHSGAGHDAMNLAAVTDAGMLFSPSRDGISHSPHEWTDPDDCAAATRVLAGGLADLAGAP